MSIDFVPGELDLLVWLNSLHTPTLDAFMYMISNVPAWIPVVLVLLWYLFYRRPWQEGVLLLLAVGICILICDRLSSGIAKPYFARLRPTHIEEIRDLLHIVYDYRGRPFGFFSGHASNFFAVGTLLSLIVGNRRFSILVYILVSLVAYSRLYMAVHAITDILAGVAIGLCVGYLVYKLYSWVRKRYLAPKIYGVLGKKSSEVFAARREVIEWVLMAYPLVLLCFSWQTALILERVVD